MRDGHCPRCQARDVYEVDARGYDRQLQVGTMTTVRVVSYVCAACGYLEQYVHASGFAAVRYRGTPIVSDQTTRLDETAPDNQYPDTPRGDPA